jgi:hypothetical protein
MPTRGLISPGGSVMSEPLNRHRYAGPSAWGTPSLSSVFFATLRDICWLTVADCLRPCSGRLRRNAKPGSSPTPVRVLVLDPPRGLSPLDPFRGHPARPIARYGRQPRVRPSTMLRLRYGVNYHPMRSYCPRRRKKSREATRDGCSFPSRIW